MPRIDPLQLLKTLAVLLSPNGGIKSSEEVVRLVQLMQKFSKKLVSKSIYIEILRATEPDLLARFLKEKGWDLLNLWFLDSIKTQNWPLCLDIMSLFEECPVTASLLKDNVESNQAPRLINQLRLNMNISENIRTLSSRVYSKWYGILSPPKTAFEPLQAKTVDAPKPISPSKQPEPVVKQLPLRNRKKALLTAPTPPKKAPVRGRGAKVQRVLSQDFVSTTDESSSETDEIEAQENVKPVDQPPVTVKIKLGNATKQTKEPAEKPTEENGAGPISLLQSLADEVTEDLNKEKEEKEKEKLGKRRRSEEEKRQKEKAAREKDREKEREKEKKRKQQQSQQQSAHGDERERKRFRPDRRDEVDPEERQRIKEKARLLKEEAQAKKDKDTLSKIGGTMGVGPPPSSSVFSRIPKIPKKVVPPEDAAKSAKTLSFEAMLGGLDAKPKTVKTPMVKNKTAALLESFTNKKSSSSSSSSSSKHHHSSSHSSHHHHHHHHKEHSSSPSGTKKESSSSSSSSVGGSSSRKDSTKKDSPSTKQRHHDDKHKSPSSASKPSKLNIPKRSGSIDMESPKSGSGSKLSMSESTGFMDALLNSMGSGEEPKKKKRRLSERDEGSSPKSKESSDKKEKGDGKTEEETSSQDSGDSSKESEESKPTTFSFYRDTLEEPNDEILNESKPTKRENKDESESDSEGSQSPRQEDKKESGDTSSSKDEKIAEKDDDLPFEEPESLPREVKGILVYHRGKDKRNKKIRFKDGSDLVSISYFEMDEDERCNVNKIKFESMREMELKMEKAAFKSKDSMDSEENDIDKWYKPYAIDIDLDGAAPFVPGHGSVEKDVQFNREKTVLSAFFFSKATTPETPIEPDAASLIPLPNREPTKMIPLEDLSADGENNERDFSSEGWPEPKVNQVDTRANYETDFSLNPALSNLLSSIEISGLQHFLPRSNPGLSQEEQNMLIAQTEAMAKLGMIPGVEPPPPFQPPRGMNMGPGPHRGGPPNMMPPNMLPPNMHPQNMGSPNENVGFGYDNQEYYDGPPHQQGPRQPPHHHHHNHQGPRHQGHHQQGFNKGQHFDRGNNRNNFNNFGPPPNNHQGGRGFNNRGFRGDRGGGGPMRGNNEFYRDRRRDGPPTRPCKFFSQTGHCRDGDNCRYLHER